MSKRRVRDLKSLGRRAPIREPYDHVLILCVGATERQYFESVRSECKLSTVNVEIPIDGEGRHPSGMVEAADVLAREKEKIDNPFDEVWLVFDRDRFEDFEVAITNAKQKDYKCAWSVPCFEFWFLLHFEYTDRPFRGSGGKTGAATVCTKLSEYIDGYKKGKTDVFSVTWDNVECALRRSRRRKDDAESVAERNPSSTVHDLVDYLRKLKN